MDLDCRFQTNKFQIPEGNPGFQRAIQIPEGNFRFQMEPFTRLVTPQFEI